MKQPPSIAVIGKLHHADIRLCNEAIERHGGRVVESSSRVEDDSMFSNNNIQGLLVCGEVREALIHSALRSKIPLLGVGYGMHSLNVALGGKPAVHVDSHSQVEKNGERASSLHRIFIPPGSKLAAVVGSGGFVRVNSRHTEGIKEPQKAISVMASAYGLDDGIIEAIESPQHEWVIAVQFHPERRMELPPHFDKLFESLVKRSRAGLQT